MTTSSTNGQIAGVIEGLVEARNDRGIRVGGDWRNVSKFHPVRLPEQGARVRLELDAKGFIHSVEVLDQVAAISASPRDRTATRLACLQAAAAFCTGKCVAGVEVKSTDVLAIAGAFERWALASEHEEG